MLHLHRLDRDDDGPGGHLGALDNVDRDDGSGHRADQFGVPGVLVVGPDRQEVLDRFLAVAGAVIEPGKPILDIVPQDDQLVVEADALSMLDDPREIRCIRVWNVETGHQGARPVLAWLGDTLLLADGLIQLTVTKVDGDAVHTVVIHGEIDDVVPLSATFDWARPQNLPVTVMPGVGHFFHGQLPRLRQLIVRQWH